ncbi:hypothetical protein [Kitasatospora sp. NPDC059327]|uniref:hypothetical protein n=1 Tax=Kitasatospora sp. NPDC059327 TaxID=3346803 RepID=UPI0036A05D3E
MADQDRRERVVARSRVGEVLAPGGDGIATPEASEDMRDPEPRLVQPEPPKAAAKPKSVVPMWRLGLAVSALSVDYQHIVRVLADRKRLDQ